VTKEYFFRISSHFFSIYEDVKGLVSEKKGRKIRSLKIGRRKKKPFPEEE